MSLTCAREGEKLPNELSAALPSRLVAISRIVGHPEVETPHATPESAGSMPQAASLWRICKAHWLLCTLGQHAAPAG